VVESVVGITALEMFLIDGLLMTISGLYTDESPGLKVDPVVVMVLSVVFIFSVVALHGWSNLLFANSYILTTSQSLPRSCTDFPHSLPKTITPEDITLDSYWSALCSSDAIIQARAFNICFSVSSAL
jgi:hypothetical protein